MARYAHPPQRRRQCPGATVHVHAVPVVGAIVLASLGALLLAADVQIIPNSLGLRSSSTSRRLAIRAPVPKSSTDHRRMSLALPEGDCVIRPALKPTRPLAPTFTASYPGSGAKMTWNLVQALTGIVTGDEHRHNDQAWSEAVTVKAHYPHIQGNPAVAETSNGDFPRVVLILRHPADALPGFHNFLYEYERGLPDHSSRAPLSAWLEWRDGNFAEQIQAWEDHTSYWMERYSDPADRLIITFEGMVDDTWGPHVALALNQFLRLTPGVDSIIDESVECVWKKIIQYKVAARPKPSAMSLKTAPSESAPLLSEIQPPATAKAIVTEDAGELEMAPAQDASQQPEFGEEEYPTSNAEDKEPTQETPNDSKVPSVQRRRRLDATPDNPDSHRTGFKKERPYTPEQLALMQDTFDRLRKRFQDPDLNDVLDLYSERVGLLQKHSVGIGFEPHRNGSVEGVQNSDSTGKLSTPSLPSSSLNPEETAKEKDEEDATGTGKLPGNQHGLATIPER